MHQQLIYFSYVPEVWLHLRIVGASSLDDKTLFSPDMYVWTEDAPKWSLFDPDVEKFDRSSIFSDNNQVMLGYDMIVPEPIGKFRAAALMNFENNKITRIELFYEARAFGVKKGNIFSGAAS